MQPKQKDLCSPMLFIEKAVLMMKNVKISI